MPYSLSLPLSLILCITGIVAQEAKDNIPQAFAEPDQIEAVEKPEQFVELEEDDENVSVQKSRRYCIKVYRHCRRHHKRSHKFCFRVYRKCRANRRKG